MRVEGVLDQRDEVLLGGRDLLLGGLRVRLADREGDREAPARHLVERVPQQVRVLRLLGELPVEGGARGELEGELERKTRVAALPHVVDGDREQVAEA